MSKKHQYKIVTSDEIIVEYLHGSFSLDELIQAKKQIYNNKDYQPNYKTIIDIRDTQLDFSCNEVKRIINEVKSHPKYFTNREIILISNNPLQVCTFLAIAKLLSLHIAIDIKICGTTRTILEWLCFTNNQKILVQKYLLYFEALARLSQKKPSFID